jgi:hypothetical protein
VAALLAAALAGCAPSLRPQAAGLDQVGEDEVVVVGRVYLNPPLANGQQKVQWGIGMGFFHHPYLVLGDAPWGDRELPQGSDLKPFNGSVQTDWNQWFFARLPRKDFWVQMLIYFTDVSDDLDCAACHTANFNWQRAYLPVEQRVTVQASDKVLFIGTYVFYRDEFNHPRGVRVYGDLKDAAPLIQARFGGAPVRVALPAKP